MDGQTVILAISTVVLIYAIWYLKNMEERSTK